MNNLQLKKLDPTNLSSLLSLQNEIVADLKDDEKHFILQRTSNDFLKSLKNDSHFVFGIFDGDRLVAQSILSLPKDNEPRELEEFLPEEKNSDIAVYKAVLVSPQYRGQGLMREMLKIRENTAIMHDRKIAITQIAADNPASWINAIKHDMEVLKVGLDPEDDAKVVYLKKDLINQKEHSQESYRLSLGSDVHKNANIYFNKMLKLSEDGYKVFAWDKTDNSLLWAPIKPQEQSARSKLSALDIIAPENQR